MSQDGYSIEKWEAIVNDLAMEMPAVEITDPIRLEVDDEPELPIDIYHAIMKARGRGLMSDGQLQQAGEFLRNINIAGNARQLIPELPHESDNGREYIVLRFPSTEQTG